MCYIKQIDCENLYVSVEEDLKKCNLFKQLDHPNMIKVFVHFLDNHNCYIMIKFIDGGNFKTKIEDKFSPF
jgi:serine/threonine protein kinase